MLRCVRVAILALAVALFCFAGAASAATDDDVPGVVPAVGGTLSQSVGSGDMDDVYAVALTAGQEVHIRCDPGQTKGTQGTVHLLVPGVCTIADTLAYDEVSYIVAGGTPYVDKHGGYFDYVPAKSGTYYL